MKDFPPANPASLSLSERPTERADIVRRGGNLVFQWPGLAAVTMMALLLGLLVWLGMGRNGGKWIYPLDDAYIHMATVKQLVGHGVWGISYLNGFSSCLSSLLYPLLLAVCYKVGGVNESAPLILNLVASAGAIFYAGVLLRRTLSSGIFTFGVLAAAVLFTPLPVVASTGMEHTWQILVDLFFADLAVRALVPAKPAASARWAAWLLPLASCLTVMIRFEGLFFVAIVGLLLLCRGRFWLAVAVGLAAALPLGLFGAYSVAHGWSFLPNSVLMKGGSRMKGAVIDVALVALFAGLFWRRLAWRAAVGVAALVALALLLPKSHGWIVHKLVAYGNVFFDYAHLIVVLVALTFMLHRQLRRHRTLWTRPAVLLCMLLVVALQHVLFAAIGWVFRYEAYLMFLGMVAVGLALADEFPGLDAGWLRRQPPRRVVAWLFLLAVLCLPLAKRTASAFWLIPQASHNIYGQQYQMARFVQRFYNGAGVAANDIGAIDYFADLRLLDTWGLADYDVFKARRQETYNQQTLRRLLAKHDVQLVMVYSVWASDYGGLLPEWIPVGKWTIPNNAICAADTVTFYAPDTREVPRLTHALQAFAPDLPGDVVQGGAYRDKPLPPAVQTPAL